MGKYIIAGNWKMNKLPSETYDFVKEVAEKVKEIDPKFTIHDFRMVIGGELTNLIFDIVVTRDTKLSDQQVKDEIQRKMKAVDPNCFTVVLIDHAYV